MACDPGELEGSRTFPRRTRTRLSRHLANPGVRKKTGLRFPQAVFERLRRVETAVNAEQFLSSTEERPTTSSILRSSAIVDFGSESLQAEVCCAYGFLTATRNEPVPNFRNFDLSRHLLNCGCVRNALSHHLRVAISTSFGVGLNGLSWLGCDMVCDMELLSDGVRRFPTSLPDSP